MCGSNLDVLNDLCLIKYNLIYLFAITLFNLVDLMILSVLNLSSSRLILFDFIFVALVDLEPDLCQFRILRPGQYMC